MVDNGLTDSPHIDEGTLHAWLDGALSADENAAVEAHLAGCGACSAAAAEARGMIAASTRILSALDTVPGDVIPRSAPQSGAALHRRPARNLRRYGPIAAVVAFAALSALVLRHGASTATDQVSAPTAALPTPSASAPQPKRNTEASTRNASKVAVGSGHPRTEHTSSGAAKRVDTRANDLEPSLSTRIAAAPAGVPAAAQRASDQALSASQAANAAVTTTAVDSAAITGRVTAAATGLPVAGASVVVAGTQSSATTDSLGSFSIPKIPSGSHTVIARRVGFAAQQAEVSVQPNQPASVSLALPTSVNSLSSVVVTGLSVARAVELPDSAPAIPGARKVSGEFVGATGRVRRTVYELGSGAKVTLTEFRAAPRPGSAFAERKATTPTTAPPTVYLRGRETVAQPVHSISWSTADGTLMMLSGSLSEAELEQLKGRLVR